jgi:hypothetical protein
VTSHSHTRRCAALIAAYALALQAILSAFALPVHALAPSFAMCAGGADSDPAREPPHEPCSACLAGHCAGAAASPDRVAAAPPWRLHATRMPAKLRAATLLPLIERREPHSPRAPPLG